MIFIIFVVGIIFAAIMYDDYKPNSFRQDFRQKYWGETIIEAESDTGIATEFDEVETLLESNEPETASDSVTPDTSIYAPKTWDKN